jgi:uncharacterized protein YcaQ
MMKPVTTISKEDARQIILASQGLMDNFFGKRKEGTLNVIEHLGYVQIDTISVVERAHHHTIWTRVNDYHKKYLEELVNEKKVFEYWSHAAAYLPMQDYRFSLVRKERYINAKERWYNNKKMLRFVLDRIKAEGPLQSKDFEENKKKAGWWEWKESKRALEQLFMEGKLMAAGRKGFQKVYDLTERVLPPDVNTAAPTPDEYAEYLVRKTIRANGLAAQKEIGYLRPHTRASVEQAIKRLIKQGEIIPVAMDEGKELLYTTIETLEQGISVSVRKTVKILSPFDNSVIQRNRLKNIFGFDYTIECYVPEKKRVYGYFCLPVLYGNEFVGRIDCKAERENELLVVRKQFFEKGFKPTQKFKDAFETSLQKFAKFNGCSSVSIK